MNPPSARGAALLAALACATPSCSTPGPEVPTVDGPQSTYAELVELFEDWRAFEQPPRLHGAPDYTAERMAEAHALLPGFIERLHALRHEAWPIEQQVDWHLLRAELNGFDFNCRVLRPWERDPAFYQTVWTYQSDVPAHEGPTNHALLELWTYDFPLTAAEEQRLSAELAVIPPLLSQARENLTGNARDLFVAGIETVRQQVDALDELSTRVAGDASAELRTALDQARDATRSMVAWLESEAPTRTGPSGVGKENYTWYLQNVHLVPLSWEDEVRLLERELARAWSSLKLEEQRNQHLPELVAAASPE